jgi:hypothetical protein
MARTKSTTKAPAKRKTTSTTTAPRKPGRPKKDRRPVVTVQLSAEKLRGMSAGKLAEFLAEQHPSSTIELHTEGVGRVELERDINAAFNANIARATENIKELVAMGDKLRVSGEQVREAQAEIASKIAPTSSPKKPPRIEALLEQLHLETDALHKTIGSHSDRINPVLQASIDHEAAAFTGEAPDNDSAIAVSLGIAIRTISHAVDRIDDLTARTQL